MKDMYGLVGLAPKLRIAIGWRLASLTRTAIIPNLTEHLNKNPTPTLIARVGIFFLV